MYALFEQILTRFGLCYRIDLIHFRYYDVNQCNASEGNEKCGRGFLKRGWKRFSTMRGGRGFQCPQVRWKRFYKDMEGNRFLTEKFTFAGVDNSQIYREYSVVSIPYRGA